MFTNFEKCSQVLRDVRKFWWPCSISKCGFASKIDVHVRIGFHLLFTSHQNMDVDGRIGLHLLLTSQYVNLQDQKQYDQCQKQSMPKLFDDVSTTCFMRKQNRQTCFAGFASWNIMKYHEKLASVVYRCLAQFVHCIAHPGILDSALATFKRQVDQTMCCVHARLPQPLVATHDAAAHDALAFAPLCMCAVWGSGSSVLLLESSFNYSCHHVKWLRVSQGRHGVDRLSKFRKHAR